MSQCGRQLMFDGPGRYRICVRAEISAIYSKRLNDLTVTVELQEGQQPVTTLTGEVRDQTALMGVLNTLYDMGCPLLEVTRLGDVRPAEDASGRSRIK
jgi:hypothetical protein